VFNVAALGKEIDAIEAAAKDSLAREKKAVEARKEGGGPGFGPPGAPGGPFGGPPMELRTFVQKRSASVAAQLAGKSQGNMPRPAFGPGGPGGLGGMLVRPILNASDANRDGKLSKEELESAAAALLKQWDKNGNGMLDEPEIQAAINSLMPAPMG